MRSGGRASDRATLGRAGALVTGALVVALAGGAAAVAGTGVRVEPSRPTGSVPAGSAPAGSAVGGSVKYYIVGPPINGQPEYLFAIATRTLGDGNRADEIFALNKGRLQADGSALADPTVLRRNWVLLLPADASGPGVRTGPLPTPGARSAPLTPGTTAGSSSLVRAVVLGGVVAIMIVALQLLRRGRRLRLGISFHRQESAGPAGPLTHADPAPGPGSVDGSLIVRARTPTDDRTNQPAGVDAAGPDPGRPARGGAGRPRPATDDPIDHLLETRVTAASGLDEATVRLAGARLPRTPAPWMWLDADASGPPAPTYIAAGAVDRRALCLDLVRAPDVLTVTGDEAKARRLSATFAGQLAGRGVAVTVVGQAVGTRVVDAQAVASLAEAETATATATATGDPTRVQIVFCGPVEDDGAVLHRLTARTSPRTIVVLVGDVPDGRWSIEVR